jgi:hypothetical protein
MFRRKLLSFLHTLPAVALNTDKTKEVRARWISYTADEKKFFLSEALKLEAAAANELARAETLEGTSKECAELVSSNNLSMARIHRGKAEAGGYWKKYLD